MGYGPSPWFLADDKTGSEKQNKHALRGVLEYMLYFNSGLRKNAAHRDTRKRRPAEGNGMDGWMDVWTGLWSRLLLIYQDASRKGEKKRRRETGREEEEREQNMIKQKKKKKRRRRRERGALKRQKREYLRVR